jgi:hypothetical protein
VSNHSATSILYRRLNSLSSTLLLSLLSTDFLYSRTYRSVRSSSIIYLSIVLNSVSVRCPLLSLSYFLNISSQKSSSLCSRTGCFFSVIFFLPGLVVEDFRGRGAYCSFYYVNAASRVASSLFLYIKFDSSLAGVTRSWSLGSRLAWLTGDDPFWVLC